MSLVCVIPARRDSKRLENKVLQTLDGKPLIVRAVETALASGAAASVIVSTEDDEIAELAAAAGASVRERPAALTGDMTSAADVALEVSDSIGADSVLFFAPVYPLVLPGDLAAAVDAFERHGADFLVSVVRTDPHDFHWALRWDQEFATLWFGNDFMVDRLLLPPVWSPTGAIKLARLPALRRTGNFFGERLLPFELPRERSTYVREEIDLRLAETLLARKSVS